MMLENDRNVDYDEDYGYEVPHVIKREVSCKFMCYVILCCLFNDSQAKDSSRKLKPSTITYFLTTSDRITSQSSTKTKTPRTQNMKNRAASLLLFSLLFISFSSISSSSAYQNYTVGDALGWFDNLEKPDINYQKWADSHSFSLGDFLIFNTDNNHSVIQTHNATVYALCDSDDASVNDTYEWSTADPSSTTPHPVTVPVPLTTEGPIFFFSGDYDGEQCQNGQHFKINVTHGKGLPDSLKDDQQALAPANPDAGNDDSAPDTVVTSDFNHPRDDKDDDGKENGAKESSVACLFDLNFTFRFVFFSLLYLVL